MEHPIMLEAHAAYRAASATRAASLWRLRRTARAARLDGRAGRTGGPTALELELRQAA
jgi:hypothetical protein